MNKEQFFSELEESLRGEVSEGEYRDLVSYYRGYFAEQESLGRSDEEILNELGSARLIAHSIIDAHGGEGSARAERGYGSGDSYYGSYGSGNDYYRTNGNYGDSYEEGSEPVMNDSQPGPLSRVFGQVGRVLVLIGVLLVVGFTIRLLLPFILVLIVVIMISNWFRRM